MNIEIITPDIVRHTSGSVDLGSNSNIKLINDYLLPVIEKNTGWGTGTLDNGNLWDLPMEDKQLIVDGALGPKSNGTVWFALEDGKSVGFFLSHVYEPHAFVQPFDDATKTVAAMIGDAENEWWKLAIRNGAVTEDFVLANLVHLNQLLSQNQLHFEYGICLTPSLQGKGTDVADQLFKQVKGVLQGWTSNPYVVAKSRRLLKGTTYFPLFGDSINDVYGLAAVVCTCASLAGWSNESWKNLEFGVGESVYFVEERGDEYLKKSKEFANKGTITKSDTKRIEYVLSRKYLGASIVGFIE